MKIMSTCKVEVENDRFIVQFQSLVKNIQANLLMLFFFKPTFTAHFSKGSSSNVSASKTCRKSSSSVTFHHSSCDYDCPQRNSWENSVRPALPMMQMSYSINNYSGGQKNSSHLPNTQTKLQHILVYVEKQHQLPMHR